MHILQNVLICINLMWNKLINKCSLSVLPLLVKAKTIKNNFHSLKKKSWNKAEIK